MYSMWQDMSGDWDTKHVLMSPLTEDLGSLLDTVPYRSVASIMWVPTEGPPVLKYTWSVDLHNWVYA